MVRTVLARGRWPNFNLAAAVQAATGDTVELAYVDQGYTGGAAAGAAMEHGIRLEVVTLPAAKRGFVLLPRRWVVERSFAWAARCRRLAKDYERLPEVVEGLHFVAFVTLMLHRLVTAVAQSPKQALGGRRVDGCHDPVLHVEQDVGIGVERDAGLAVPEPFAHRLGRRARSLGQRDLRVPEVVPPRVRYRHLGIRTVRVPCPVTPYV